MNASTLMLRMATISQSLQYGVLVEASSWVVNGIDMGNSHYAGGTYDPGNNEITSTVSGNQVGLYVGAENVTVYASGNTWKIGYQGAAGDGGYSSPGPISGPIAITPGDNYAIMTGSSIVF